MYQCNMCRKQFDAEPALCNGAGKFCPECKAVIHLRGAEKMRERRAQTEGVCAWCGGAITTASPSAVSHEGCQIHASCETKRDWLLGCIRYSDKPARYVARTEEREKAQRIAREKAMRDAAAAKVAERGSATIQQPDLPNESEARLLRLEKMLNKLTSALGV